MLVGVTHLVDSQSPAPAFCARAAAAGYEAVELALTAKGGLNPNCTAADLAAIRDAVRQHGLTLASLTINHCTGNLLAGGDLARQSIEQTVEGLKLAHELGAPVALHTLGRQRPEVYYDQAYANAVAALRELADTCEKLRVRLAVEFIWNGFLFSPMEMRRFLDDVGSPWIGFYFDPGNMAVFQFPQHWVRIVGRHIVQVHLKDWKGGALNGEWPPLLEGTVDFPAVIRELRAIGYDGPLVSEVPESVASLEATAEAIRRIIAMA